MSIEIQQMQRDDLGALKALREHKEPGYFERCLEEQEQGARILFVAREGELISGYGIYNRKPLYALYKKLNIPEIQDLFVVTNKRQKGIATKLIQCCEEMARKESYTQMGISVGLYGSYGPAQRLYGKLGYIADGQGITYGRETVQPGAFHPVDDDLCLMMVRDL